MTPFLRKLKFENGLRKIAGLLAWFIILFTIFLVFCVLAKAIGFVFAAQDYWCLERGVCP